MQTRRYSRSQIKEIAAAKEPGRSPAGMIKYAILNLLSSGTHLTHSIEQRRRIVLLTGTILTAMVFMIPFGIIAVRRGYAELAIVNFSAVFMLLILLLVLRSLPSYWISAAIGTTAIGILLLYCVVYGGVDNSGHLWSFTFPLLAVFLLGTRAGFTVTALFLALVIAFFLTGIPVESARYSAGFQQRFIGAYLAVTFLAFFIEYINIQFEKRIREENEKIKKAHREARTASAEAKESDTTIHSLIERSTDGIILIQDKVVKMINSRLAGLGGYSVEECIGRPFTDFVHPDAVKDLHANYLLRMKGVALPSTYKSALQHRNGDRIDVEVDGGRIFMKGRPADLVFIRELKQPPG